MKLRDKKIFFSLLIALIYFPPQIRGIQMIKVLYAYIIPFLYLALNINTVLKLFTTMKNKKVMIAFIILFFLILVSAIHPILLQTFDFSYLTTYWKVFITLFFKTVFLVIFFYRTFGTESNVFNYIDCFLYTICEYVLVSSVMIFNSNFRRIMNNILVFDEIQNAHLSYEKNYTRIGWIGFSGFNMTIICTLGLILCIFILLQKTKNGTGILKYYIIAALMLLGNMFYGRVGVIGSVLSIGIMLIYLFFNSGVKYKKTFFSVILFVVVAIVVVINQTDKSDIIKKWYDWVFAPINNYLTSGTVTISSMEKTIDMYFKPPLATVIFGDGRYVDPNNNLLYYMHTDPGLMRQMLFFGLPYCILAYCAVLIFLRSICGNLQIYYNINLKLVRVLFFM
ncbi:MAG: hypothetical protein NC489_33595, partial [Ruminococcus flavefaciens]|nr:hypothetical protein [Ruminococcus flavefaciens]